MKPRELLRAAADLLLPRICVACERLLVAGDTGMVCGLCWSRMESLPHPQCERCGHPLSDEECSWCAQLRPFIRAARSCYWYPGGPAGALLRALKYDGWGAVAEAMGERMARLAWPPDVERESPVLVPVPLARSRIRERGYNQSALLAAALSRRRALPIMLDCLARSRSTTSQTRLSPDARASNVSGAFSLSDAAAHALRGAHVLLVDDVVTTAATLNECAEALFVGGVRTVSLVTFGRARSAGDSG